MAIPAEAESRREHRQRVLKGASILNGINNSEVACMVRNMNKGGAELRVAMESRVPEEFLLYVPVDGVAYRATLVWRAGERVGVRFGGTEPKPHWHYG
ncbi:PilZ domain-containing protein [Mesorhizobium australicum]|uniref:PilZ domain-containing protein n=1 Tax=Mesorhizobium australicum TaxID=536018 RepID=A0A1X7P6H7_9HYPH|nr:PilZ domain-containing protein [Mesorhizobium australicum]SMH46548.1 PilZ domain-containing protein [Mesorhizobium australicum]